MNCKQTKEEIRRTTWKLMLKVGITLLASIDQQHSNWNTKFYASSLKNGSKSESKKFFLKKAFSTPKGREKPSFSASLKIKFLLRFYALNPWSWLSNWFLTYIEQKYTTLSSIKRYIQNLHKFLPKNTKSFRAQKQHAWHLKGLNVKENLPEWRLEILKRSSFGFAGERSLTKRLKTLKFWALEYSSWEFLAKIWRVKS